MPNILQRVIDQWKHDWNTNKFLFFFELIGTASSILASVLISFWPTIINLIWVFIFWLIGSILLTITSYIRSTGWPMLLMITYSVFNIIGLYNLL